MSAISLARSWPPARVSRNLGELLLTTPIPGQGSEFNGRLIFPDMVSLDGRTLAITASPWFPVDRLLGRIARMEPGVGLQTSDNYGSSWTTRVTQATLIGSVSPAYSVHLIGCEKLGSTYHFMYVIRQSNNIESLPWFYLIRHVSTTDFSSWSSATTITDNSGSDRFVISNPGPRTGILYKVGSNLFIPNSFDESFSGQHITSTNGVNWTKSARTASNCLLQAWPGTRLFDVVTTGFGLSAAYSDDGASWTTFSMLNSFNTLANSVAWNGKFLVWANTGSWGLWETKDPATVAFSLSPISTAIVSPANQPSTLVAAPHGLVNPYAYAGGAYLRYFV